MANSAVKIMAASYFLAQKGSLFLPSSSAAAYDALGTLFVFCEFRPRKKQKRTASHHFAKRPLVGGMAWRGCRETAVRESSGVVWI